jgi:ribosomal protein S18 acetylase RimI-like enzyme
MPITFRPGTIDDSYAAYKIFEVTLADFATRKGMVADQTSGDPEAWDKRRPLYEHLARTGTHFWIAQDGDRPVGYARSIERDGVLELTEFFVLPEVQSGGVGRELLARAFPVEGAKHRTIIATNDLRAQGRYLRAGVYPRFPIYFIGREPQEVTIKTDLTLELIGDVEKALPVLASLDQAILGHRRDEDHRYLLSTRQGYICQRNGQPVGYGYVGRFNGPFALLDDRDFPAVLAHAESQAHARGEAKVGFEVGMINKAAVDYLLGRGFRLDAFFAFYMSDAPFGRFENYIFTSPPFFM